MGIFQRRLRLAVAQQPGDGEDILAPPESEARMRVPQVVEAQVVQVRFRANLVPEAIQPACGSRSAALRSSEDLAALARERIENVAGGFGQPHGSRPGSSNRGERDGLRDSRTIAG